MWQRETWLYKGGQQGIESDFYMIKQWWGETRFPSGAGTSSSKYSDIGKFSQHSHTHTIGNGIETGRVGSALVFFIVHSKFQDGQIKCKLRMSWRVHIGEISSYILLPNYFFKAFVTCLWHFSRSYQERTRKKMIAFPYLTMQCLLSFLSLCISSSFLITPPSIDRKLP